MAKYSPFLCFWPRLNGHFVGKVAVVTASTDGIGFAIAKKLAIDGAKVVISSRKVCTVCAGGVVQFLYKAHDV